jgi:hypothetical protein
MTLFLFVSNFELSKHLSVFVPLWLNDYKLSSAWLAIFLWITKLSIARY